MKLSAAFAAGAAGCGRGILRHAEGAAQAITTAPILPAANAALEAPTKSTRSRAAMISMVSRMAWSSQRGHYSTESSGAPSPRNSARSLHYINACATQNGTFAGVSGRALGAYDLVSFTVRV